MRDSNLSTVRRLEALEARLDAADRILASQSQRARSWQWPRDMWLGRTYAVSESSYPTDGDTFQVKLLSAHYTASEGTQAVTENERGTIVTARTWPATYLPYDSEVVVKRMRGIGPNGAGEWWIEPTGAGYNRCVMAGLGGATYTIYGGMPYDDTNGYIPYGATASDGAWSFPWLVGVRGNSGGRVFAERSPTEGSALGPPTAWDDWWLECEAFTWYRISIHTTWRLHGPTDYFAQAYVQAGPHTHDYTDDGAARATSPDAGLPISIQARSIHSRDAIVRTELVPDYGSRWHMGSSSLEITRMISSPDHTKACHSGVAIVSGVYRPGPLRFRIRVYREDTYSSITNADIESMSVTVEQASDPIDTGA